MCLLQWAAQQAEEGSTSATDLQRGISARIQDAGGRVDYVEVRLFMLACFQAQHMREL